MDKPMELRLELCAKDQYGPINVTFDIKRSTQARIIDDHWIPPEWETIYSYSGSCTPPYKYTWTRRQTGGPRPVLKGVATPLLGDYSHSPPSIEKMFGGDFGPYAKDVITGEDGMFVFSRETTGFRSLDPSTKSFSEFTWYHAGHANHSMALAASNLNLFSVNPKNELYRRELTRTDMAWKKIGSIEFDVVTMTAYKRRLFAISKDDSLWSYLPPMRELDTSTLNGVDVAESYFSINLDNGTSKVSNVSGTTNSQHITTETWTEIGKVKVASTPSIIDHISRRIINTIGKDDYISNVVADAIVNHNINHDDISAIAMNDNNQTFLEKTPNNIIALAATNGNLFAVTRKNELLMRPASTEDIPWLSIGYANYVISLGATQGNLYGVNKLGELWQRSSDVTASTWQKGHLTNPIKPITLSGINTGWSGVLYAVTKADDALWLLDTPRLIT